MTRETIITKAVKENNPKLLADFVGKSIEEITSDRIHIIKNSCATTLMEHIRHLGCLDLYCNDCPFSKGIENAINWLKSK